MAIVYATVNDYQEWSGDNSSVTGQELRSASLRVAELTVGVIYDADPATHLPLETAVTEAFRDATCAQVAATREVKARMSASSKPVALTSASSNGVSYSFDASAARAALEATNPVDASGYSLEAIRILRVAGLTHRTIVTVG
ncbi:hypothetical protein GCM10009785_01550 [Brooklawnia cerclae]|uniref:Uncharacterized protein n=1 Tax=Brooklawnia cerclae TaxID=349934 RepID=A0ABX0SE58_9ACTN|nr:hypothetical protein [Brooklawnia cerclae]NIH56251.1 hypothetical protein [Brooklawnia cerclae]